MLSNDEIIIICEKLKEKEAAGTLEGIIDLPIEVYHHPLCPGLSKTECSILLQDTYFELKRQKDLKLKYSEATEEEILEDDELLEIRKQMEKFKHGRAVHTLCLEPHKFEEEFIEELDYSTKPKPVSQKKDDKAIYELQMEEWERDFLNPWKELSSGKTVLKRKDMKRAKRVSKMITNHPTFQKIIKGALIEQTIFFIWEGVLFKTRPDILNKDLKLCPDLKTAQDISDGGFKNAITRYMYDLQGAIQIEGVKQVFGDEYMFGFFAAENHDCRPLRLDDPSLREGKDLMALAVKKLKDGIEKESKGIHTGYSHDFEMIQNARWAMYRAADMGE